MHSMDGVMSTAWRKIAPQKRDIESTGKEGCVANDEHSKNEACAS